MSIPDEHSTHCSHCDCYNLVDVWCGDCHKTAIREALKSVELREKPPIGKDKYEGMENRGYNQAVKQQKENHIKHIEGKGEI